MTDLGRDSDDARREAMADRATRLFRYLAEAQRLKSRPARRTDSYPTVLWFADFPHHPAVAAAHRGSDPEPEAPLLSIDRVPRAAPPPTIEPLASWLDGPVDDPRRPPELRDSITVVDDAAPAAGESDGIDDPPTSRRLDLNEHPDVRHSYDAWLVDWRAWANQEHRDRPVRDLYGQLFKAYANATGNPEEFELVAGVGCLSWAPPDHDPVRRHLLTTPVMIKLDDRTGRLTVDRVESPDPVKIELDMLDPGLTGSPHLVDVKATAQEFDAHPLHRDEAGAVVRRLVHILDSDGEYRDVDRAPEPAAGAVAAYAPAIVLRRRSQQGMVEIYRTIVQQITDAGDVPDGLLTLIDPDHVPSVTAERADGALVTVDEEPFLPLPVNDVQLRIIRQVDTKAQTLVQGPPGTGKTHTAAALLAHLLAQGQRVLVTAHTDRALKEVREKLPAKIKPLSVSVLGTSRDDMSDLTVAVGRIAAAAAERDPSRTKATIRSCYQTIDRLRRQRAQIYRQLIDLRADEVREHHRGGLRGTLAAIATRHHAEAAEHGWLVEYASVTADAQPPVESAEMVEWLSYLRDTALLADEPEASQSLVDLTTVPEPRLLAAMATAERAAAETHQRYAAARAHAASAAISTVEPAARRDLRTRLTTLADTTDALLRRPEPWVASALADVQTGRAGIWQGRAQRISVLIGQAETAVRRLGSLHDVSVNGTDLGPLVALATTLAQHLSAGNSVKMAADGTPKVGAFAAKPVKQAHELFSRVRVNGLPPTTPAQLDAFVTWVDATRTMTALDRAWPDGLHIPAEDTLHERLQWHVTEFAQLRRVVEYGAAVAAAERCLDHLRLPGIVDWTSPTAVRGYILLIDAAYAAEELAATRVPFQRLEPAIADRARQPDASPTVRRLHAAIQQRDEREYTAAYGRLHRLAEVRRIIHRRDALGARIASAAPAVRRAIEDSVADEVWNRRAATFRQAWDWAATATWLRERETLDVNALQAEVTVIERRIRHEVEELASTRAWGHAVSEDRLTGTARANLEQYAYLVRRHGKGTGKYAVQQRAEIRQAMDRCRPAVPVWIMPIYRIAEHLRITPNMFDVVIVDEASQAGLEATFLQYLAPKIVVIGDDKQVSPSAVGIDRQQLRDLARQYLLDDPYRASWQDPQRSLFDEAKMRFHGLLTLVEHRRCVPEIIGFSNRIAYEPDGVRLIPVRQYGSDRLEPIKPVLVADGYVRGTSTHKINPGEVDAIVDQIEKCIADPRYDGLTFGVISLLGKAQARAIEKKLLDRIPAAEWSGRDLRCGDSADFQGSERDVIFLSMVAAPEPDQPLRAVTGDAYVQRYNVAASRAKDQMWLFHSVPLADVGNPEDLRFQLLDYCYGVVRRADAADAVYETPTGSVPHDRLVSPFDSLFEQRVFNRLFDRGHTVVPQYPVESYKIDLVVVGPKTRLAIECDGDAWHGPDAYERDLARQRELERCGWRFFRIRESAFCVDEPGVLRDLWETLASLDIHPSGVSLDEAVPAPPTAVPLDEPEPAGISVPQAVQPSIEEPAPASVPGEEPSDDAEPVSSSAQPSPLAARDWPVVGPTAPNGTALAAYEEFRGTVTPALEASRQQLLDGITAIVAAEGPVLGYRLHGAYVKASGGQRVGPVIAKELNRAISAAVRQGVLMADNPLGESGVKPQTYRLPGQERVRLRSLGARDLNDMPPRELAALMSSVAEEEEWATEEDLYRAVLDRLGLKRLTPNVIYRLQAVRVLSLTERPPRHQARQP